MSGSLPCFSHISASHNLGPLRITLLIFLCRSINTLMPSNLMTLMLGRAEYNDKLLSKDPDIESSAGIPGGKDIQIPGTGIGLMPFGRFFNKFVGLVGRNVQAVIIGSGGEMELSLQMDLYGKQTVVVIRQDENLQKMDNKIDSNVDKTHQN